MTTTLPDAAGVYHDLSMDIHARAEMSFEAAQLSVDDFASRYGSAIRSHYTKSGYVLDPEECYELAARLWRWLRET